MHQDDDRNVGRNASTAEVARIMADPGFRELVRHRNVLGSGVVLVTMIMYFGYLGLLAFAPGLMRSHATAVVTMGFPIGLGVIVATILIVAFTVWRASTELDRLTRDVVARMGR